MHRIWVVVQTYAKHSLLANHGSHNLVVVTRHSIHLQDHILAAYIRHVRNAVLFDACDGHVSSNRDAKSHVVCRAYELNVKCIPLPT